MPMRKIINDPSLVEDQTVDGILAAFPGHLKRIDGTKRGLIRGDAPLQGKVAIATGGGSGPTGVGSGSPGATVTGPPGGATGGASGGIGSPGVSGGATGGTPVSGGPGAASGASCVRVTP